MILLCGTENLDAKLRIKQALQNAGLTVTTGIDMTLFDTCSQLKDGSSLFLLNDDTGVSSKMALKIAYAMLQERPITLNRSLTFQPEVNLFLRDLLGQRVNKFVLCNYEILDEHDLHELVKNTNDAPVKYSVTKHEAALIKSYLKAQFRV